MCLCSLKYPTLMSMRRIVIHGMSGSIRFFHIISQTEGFSKKRYATKICVLILSTNHYWNISNSKKNGDIW